MISPWVRGLVRPLLGAAMLSMLGMAGPTHRPSAAGETLHATSVPSAASKARSTNPSPPRLVLAAVGIGLCLFGFMVRGRWGAAGTALWFAGVALGIAALAIWGRNWVEVHPARAVVGAGILGILAAIGTLPEEEPAREAAYRRSVLLLIGLFAFGLRWSELARSVDRPLDPDAQTYLEVARNLRAPFDTGMREPLTIWLVRTSLILFGDSETSLRVASVFFSLLAVGASYVLANRLFGWRVGCATAAFLAWWPDARIFSVRGLRDELIAGGVWLFLAVLLAWNKPSASGAFEVAPLALATAGLWLTTLTALAPSLLLLGVAVVMKRLRPRAAVAVVIFGLCVVAPFAWSNWKRYGDPLFSLNISARGFANYESAGKPGFPSREEVRLDLFAGKHITMTQYVFGQHSLREVFTRTLRGYMRLLDGRFRGLTTIRGRTSWLLLTLWLLGSVLALMTGSGRYLICAILLWLGPIAFLGGANEFDLDPRLTSPIWALQASVMGLAVIVLGRGNAHRLLARGDSQATGSDTERSERNAASSASRR